jgi:hypothetical protein
MFAPASSKVSGLQNAMAFESAPHGSEFRRSQVLLDEIPSAY